MIATLVQVAGGTAGPSFAVHGWQAVLVLGGILAAAATAVIKFIYPITKAALLFTANWGRIVEILPKLAELAEHADELLAVPAIVKSHDKRLAQVQSDVSTMLQGHKRVREGDTQ